MTMRAECLRSVPRTARLAAFSAVAFLTALVMAASPVRSEPAATDEGTVWILLRIPDPSVRESWYDEDSPEVCLGGPERDMPVIVRELSEKGDGNEITALGCDDVRIPVAPRGADEPIVVRIEPL